MGEVGAQSKFPHNLRKIRRFTPMGGEQAIKSKYDARGRNACITNHCFLFLHVADIMLKPIKHANLNIQ